MLLHTGNRYIFTVAVLYAVPVMSFDFVNVSLPIAIFHETQDSKQLEINNFELDPLLQPFRHQSCLIILRNNLNLDYF